MIAKTCKAMPCFVLLLFCFCSCCLVLDFVCPPFPKNGCRHQKGIVLTIAHVSLVKDGSRVPGPNKVQFPRM